MKKKKGIKDEVQLTSKQKEMMQAQLEKEAAIRKRLQGVCETTWWSKKVFSSWVVTCFRLSSAGCGGEEHRGPAGSHPD